MHIAECIELYLANDVHSAFTKQLEQTQESQLSAYGTSEGVEKSWDTRGRGRAKNSEGKTQQFLHKGFHDTLSKLGYRFEGTYGERKAGSNESHYYHSVSQRSVNVSEDGRWNTQKGDGIKPRERGENPGEFFKKYHGAK